MHRSVRVGVIGVGNCAASLVQGVAHYAAHPQSELGLMHAELAGLTAADVEFSCAFDVSAAKVGKDLSEAILVAPNNGPRFAEVAWLGVPVVAGPVFDGVGDKYRERIETVDTPGESVGDVLKRTATEVVVNYLPVGSAIATEHYARQAALAGCAFVNAIPVPLAREQRWHEFFSENGVPLIGDDIKSQFGATILHRAVLTTLRQRGVRVDRTYQLNVGGNMDFYNMLERGRLAEKRRSKTEAVTSVVGHEMGDENVHIGPSDFVPWLEDHKVAYIRCEGRAFAGTPFSMEIRLEVCDSPNSAGVVIDAVRCAKLALDRRIGGVLAEASAWLMKAPMVPCDDGIAMERFDRFVAGD